MKRKLDKVLLQKRGRIAVRTAVWAAVVLFGGIAWLIVDSASAIAKRNTEFRAYNACADSVRRLESLAPDSLLAKSVRLSEKGVLIGWEGAAQWLEAVQSYGRNSGIGMEYRIDSLLYPSEGAERLRLLPLNLYLTSKVGEFETVVRLLENICGDTATSAMLTGIDMIKDNSDYLKTSAVVYRWIKL